MKFIINTKDEGLMLKEFLFKQEISKKSIKAIKMMGDILVNGVHQTVRYQIKKNDLVELIWPEEKTKMGPFAYPLKIVYEDDDYLIIDKPAGIPCIPTKRYPEKTLANAIIFYYQKNNIDATVHLVNRLDKDTQGLMLVAKKRQSHYLISKDIKQVKRVYHCLVEGIIEGEGIIDQPILKDSNSVRRLINKKGKRAVTYYRSLKVDNNQSLVECILETGRTHQIRVHLSSLGHPLIGDRLYGSKEQEEYYLDSVEIEFIHPLTNKHIKINKKRFYDE